MTDPTCRYQLLSQEGSLIFAVPDSSQSCIGCPFARFQACTLSTPLNSLTATLTRRQALLAVEAFSGLAFSGSDQLEAAADVQLRAKQDVLLLKAARCIREDIALRAALSPEAFASSSPGMLPVILGA